MKTQYLCAYQHIMDISLWNCGEMHKKQCNILLKYHDRCVFPVSLGWNRYADAWTISVVKIIYGNRLQMSLYIRMSVGCQYNTCIIYRGFSESAPPLFLIVCSLAFSLPNPPSSVACSDTRVFVSLGSYAAGSGFRICRWSAGAGQRGHL